MSSLGRKAVSGVLWNTGLNVFRDFLQFGLMLVLVRLLAPEVYGQFGLVTSIMGFLSVFSFRVFLEHTLQIRPGAEADYQMHFTAGAVLQFLAFLGTNLAAAVLKHFEKYAPVAPVVHVMSLLFLLDLGSELRVKMLEREMNWKRLRILQGIGVVANAVLSLIMAVAGAGVFALLVPTLFALVPANVDLFFIQRWRPTWKWQRAAFEPARHYGLTRMMSAVLLWSRNLSESTVLVQMVGFSLYGIYGRAVGLAAICCLKVPSLLIQALFPVLTKFHPGSDSSSKATTLVLCSVAWTTFPVAVIVSALAYPVIHTLYGARWLEAIPFLPLAMAAGVATALAQTGSILLVANLQQKWSLYIDAVILAGIAASLLLLAPRGLKLYLAGTAAVYSGAFLLMLVRMYQKQLVDIRGIGDSLVLPAACVAAGFLVLQLVRARLNISTTTVGGAIFCGALFGPVYLLLLRLTSGRQCREVVSFLPGRAYLQRWLLLET